jgi:hypothetical protein
MASITTELQASSETQPAQERREAVRYRCLRDCVVRLEGGTPGVGDWPGMVYDLSVLGVGVIILYPLAVGTDLVIEKFGRGSARTLHATVVRSAPLEFVWLHGCQLKTSLTEAELHDWLK